MQKTLCILVVLMSVLTGHAQTSFNHPVSGSQQVNLGPGTYHYYDDGGPNGDYGGDINSQITFSPPLGYYIKITFLQFLLEDPVCGGLCCDYLNYVWYDACPGPFSIYQSGAYCGQDLPPSQILCGGSGITFQFNSDSSVEEQGWYIVIEVLRKEPSNIICTDDFVCSFLNYLDCDLGPTITGTEVGFTEGRTNVEFACQYLFPPSGECNGFIDYYPGCDNDYHPGVEAVYYLTLDEAKTLTLQCHCFTDVYALREGGCACSKFIKNGDEFTLADLPEGNYYIIAEIDCNGEAICSCDLLFSCETPGGSGLLDCSAATPIGCNSTDFSSNSAGAGGVANVNSYCNPPLGNSWTGRERVYSFYSDINGIVQISLTGLSENLDLFVLKSCERTDCVATSTKGGIQSESISLNVKKGETYYIVIDGVNFAQSTYLLEIQCEEQENCVECGQCFTYSLVNKGVNTEVVCRSKYVDCTIPNFPTANHSFRWTIDGIQASTAQSPTLTIPTHKQVTICQEVRLNNTIVYQCCWVVNPAPGCQAAPVAHWTQTSGPLDVNVVLNGSGSKGAGRFYWDFGDGSPIVSTDQNPVGMKTYTNIPERAPCVYVQNAWGISQYCKTIGPGALHCASSPSPKFDYTLTGNTLSITSDNPFGDIKEWEIDYGNGTKTNGTTWSTQAHTYANAGVYEVCIRFQVEHGQSLGLPCLFDGCIYFTVKVGCCTTVQDNCSNLKFNFVSENNGLMYSLSRATNFNQPAIGWEIDDVPVANSTQNTIQYLFPVAGVYKICFIYLDTATGCFVKCCRYIWIGNPFDCGTIYFLYETGKGYQFYTEADGSNFTWTNDDTGEEIGQGKISNFLPIPGSGDCIEVNISVRYFDPACNCWRICCLRIFLCDPTECQDEITVITQPGPGGSTALCVDNGLTNVRWTCLDNNQLVGTGTCINITDLNCQIYCVQYYDPVGKRYRVCCKDLSSSVKEPESLTRIEIRPNPFGEWVMVTVEFEKELQTRLELFDVHGRAVEVGMVERGPGMLHEWQVDTRHLAVGVYSLRIVTSEGEIIRRLVKVP